MAATAQRGRARHADHRRAGVEDVLGDARHAPAPGRGWQDGPRDRARRRRGKNVKARRPGRSSPPRPIARSALCASRSHHRHSMKVPSPAHRPSSSLRRPHLVCRCERSPESAKLGDLARVALTRAALRSTQSTAAVYAADVGERELQRRGKPAASKADAVGRRLTALMPASANGHRAAPRATSSRGADVNAGPKRHQGARQSAVERGTPTSPHSPTRFR